MKHHVEEESDQDEDEATEPTVEPDSEVDTDDDVTELEPVKEAAVDATVWDKTEDRDESPSPYVEDVDKIKLPKELKSKLEADIKELQKESDALIVTDYLTAEAYNNAANAMIDVLNHLNKETEQGMKLAQICIGKYMSPIVQKFDKDVVDFIYHGGYSQELNTSNSLVSIFKDNIKKG